jgi:hypothetical membrane protein
MNLTEAFRYLAPLIGTGTLVIGILAMFRPESMSKKFGISASDKTLPYVKSTGVRDVFIGLTVLILFYLKDWVALGWVNLFIGIVAISDFSVVLRNGDKNTSLVHLFGAILVLAFGSWLLCH